MFKLKRNLLAAVIFFLITSMYGQATRVLLNSGHNGPINALAFQQKYELLFSCGSDGTVRAWDTKTKSLVFLLQVSHLPVRMISLNPDKPQVAVVESDGLQIFRLSLWDWQQKRRLYTINLTEIPLFLRFSPQGNLLVYGKADWNGIVFLDAQEGTALPLLQEGTGIVSDVFISSTENSLLSYSPSGSIKYWDLRTRTKRAEFSTLSNLNSIGFSADGRYMTGLYEGRLVVIDLVTGRSIDQREIQNPILAKVNPVTGDILCLSSGRNPVLTLWTLSQGRLSPNITDLKPPGEIGRAHV